MVGIHKHSNHQLVNQWWKEIVINLLYSLGVFFLEVFNKFGITNQLSSCDNGFPRVHHYTFICELFQVAKYLKAWSRCPFLGKEAKRASDEVAWAMPNRLITTIQFSTLMRIW